MNLLAKGIGTKKGIPLIMISASSFDDIVAITAFIVLVSISFDTVDTSDGAEADIGKMIGMNVVYVIAGVGMAFMLGFLSRIYNKITFCRDKALNWVKFV